MFGIGIPELLVILVICLLVFGAARLPEIGKALGTTIKEFKKSLKDMGPEDDKKKKEEQAMILISILIIVILIILLVVDAFLTQ